MDDQRSHDADSQEDSPRGEQEQASQQPQQGQQQSESQEQDSGSNGEAGSGRKSSSLEDQNEVTAPSVGPNTTFDRDPPEERLARHEQSDEDAMGLDKRREVVGKSYGPSVARQATLYGIFLAVAAALVIGFILLAGKLDQPPETYADQAPWSDADAPQRAPQELE